MPLKYGYSDRTRSSNISELVKSGRSVEQASAIAYDIQRKAKRRASARKRRSK